ncbi:GNAT family N-acetyltransferase [Paenibacillus hexagrammi]|uniref:GNAT family N-acetyltransferase n=1 Tax=Paenibacillus hexagrammi TaxID=2908839 RepID=A0ABY3SG82_9BACL|nr:GNAT family N-acetyltransferase [Paenibacillus sp. YPD9-1]UJF32450.1 GNAT family N-acetyltransferase [Paenibacillus sp. YPD9-1]
MTIRKLPLETNEEILTLLTLQTASYRVEAQLIGFEDIPPLKDGIASIRSSTETFIGYFLDDDGVSTLAGVISYSCDGSVVTICRMMVHPDYFRRGIASSLLQFVLAEQEERGASRFVVSTGAANYPAVELYQSFGFAKRRTLTVGPGITLTVFERPAG